MDPLSALSVAASVVQFIDFTQSLVSGAYEISISTSRLTNRNDTIQKATKSLTSLNHDIRKSLGRASSGLLSSRRDEEIERICAECEIVAEELLDVLEKLRTETKNSKWGSNFYQALRTMWKYEKIKALTDRLDAFRQQIQMQITVSLRY